MDDRARDTQSEAQELEELTAAFQEALKAEDERRLEALLAAAHPAELADVLESLPKEQRLELWRRIPEPRTKGELLIEARREVRDRLIEVTPASDLAEAVAGLELDELADLYQRLPRKVIKAVLRAMDAQRRQRLRRVLSYPHDTAGGLMDADAVAVREDLTLETVLRYLRRMRRKEGGLPEHTAMIMVVDKDNHYRGVLKLSDLVSLEPDVPVAEVMDAEFPPLQPDLPASRVSRIFEDRDLVSAPVVDEQGQLIGRITVDDVLDVIRGEGERSVMHTAGLTEQVDMFAPVFSIARRRGLWLLVNLFHAFFAAYVIGLFDATIEQMVALAVLMPVVASMGGVSGIQTLTLVTRGLALDQVGRANALRLLLHELGVNLINGAVFAVLLGAIALLWFSDIRLGAIFGLALVINLVNAAISGTIIPLGLARVGIDPALAGGVLLTAATDTLGFFSFLGLAAWLLL